MYIANPLYDVAFKFMMDDPLAAKTFIATIIGEEIIDLALSSQERAVKLAPPGADTPFAVYRLDFIAKIKTPDGAKTLTIELQKAKNPLVLGRFRRYLAEQLVSPDTEYPLYCIYLLGAGYSRDLPPRTVLKVDFDVRDALTGEKVDAKIDFVEGLHHRSWVVQTQLLNGNYHTDVERLLAIFDQHHRTRDPRFLDIEEQDFPEPYRFLVRRLMEAQAMPEVRGQMQMEDEYLELLREKDGQLAERQRLLDENQRLLEESQRKVEESQQQIEESQQKIDESQQKIAEQQQALAEKDRLIAELRR